MKTQEQPDTTKPKRFFHFPNHGDEDGNNCYTICYGWPGDDDDVIIVGAEDTEEDANEARSRLNGIVEPLRASLSEERQRADKLQAFKDYVHKRLDDAGIDKDPESEHKAAGCRIGGRLDIVLSERRRNEELKQQTITFEKHIQTSHEHSKRS